MTTPIDFPDSPGLAAPAHVQELIRVAWDDLGGRGTKADVVARVHASLTADDADYLAGRGLATAVNGFFRVQAADGLPQAPAVDDQGTHAQLEVLTVDEWRYLVDRYVSASLAQKAQAVRAQARCLDIHGVLIDLDDPWAEAL